MTDTKAKVQTWTEPRHKVIGVPLAKSMEKQADGTLIVRGYFTSDNKDEVGDIITRAATERAVAKYKQWGNIRRMHLPDPVGKVLRMSSGDGLEWNEVEIKVIDPKAVFEVENGLLSALSVGIFFRYEDIDILESGGLIINDYTMAEISLVDHPANYDAKLKNLPVEQGLQMLARQYGMDALAVSMSNLLNKELSMEEETKELVETGAIETSDAVEGAVEEAEKSAEETQEEVVEEQPAEDVVEETPDTVSEETAEQPAEEEVSPLDEVKSMLAELAQKVASLAETVSKLIPTSETEVEAPEAKEQAIGGEEGEKEAALSGEVIGEPGAPANRKGALPETELPGETEKGQEADAPVKDLRQALRKYFETRNS